MRIVIPKEIVPHETRVALIPETVSRLIRSGLDVCIESGAGFSAGHKDQDYIEAGAQIAAEASSLYDMADLVLKVRRPVEHPALGKLELDLYPEGAFLLAMLDVARHPELVEQLVGRSITGFSLLHVPRISRAQKMDVFSSMSTVAGYKAALLAADSLPKFFPLMMTAAGTIAPARVFVIGAGVAGLQAIATCRRLGAVVEATDVRPAVREEVQSLGAAFVDLQVSESEAVGEGGYAKELSEKRKQEERKIITEHLQSADAVICTAFVHGRPAPKIITTAMVESMKPGSVIVDLAAEQGGNCEVTRASEKVMHHDVLVRGPLHLVTSMPVHASQMYSRNIAALLQHLIKDGEIHLDFDDEITASTCVARAPTLRQNPEASATT